MKRVILGCLALMLCGFSLYAQENTTVPPGKCQIFFYGTSASAMQRWYSYTINFTFDTEEPIELGSNEKYLVITTTPGRHTISAVMPTKTFPAEFRDSVSFFLSEGKTIYMCFKIGGAAGYLGSFLETSKKPPSSTTYSTRERIDLEYPEVR